MTSLNAYLDSIKPIAKSFHQKATKLTDALDEKLKKTQENLEKQRIKAVASSESEVKSRRWRASSEHPLGEIVEMPTPTPSTPSSAPVLPEKSRTTTVTAEPQTVTRRKTRRSRKTNDFENDNERKQQIHQCLNDIIDEIIKNEDMDKCSNQLIDIITIIDDFIGKTSTSTQENLKTDLNSIEENVKTEYNPIEENPELVNIQSSTIETDSFDLMNPVDTSLEQSEEYDINSNIKSSEEHIDSNTHESSIEETDTSDTTHTYESLSSLISNPEIDSFTTSLPLSSTVIDPPIDEFLQKSRSTTIKQEKQFSALHCYSIPSDVIVSHMSCSSTHIYICTNHQLLFYAKAPEHHLTQPLQWYQYPLPAERLIVSNSNQTIWRIYDKTIYLSSDTVKLSPLGIRWTELKFNQGESFLSIAVNDQYGWYIKTDGTLWLIKLNDKDQQSINVTCPFDLNHVVCSVDKIGVTTSDGQIIIRIGCTNDCPEGGGWIFIEHDFGPFDDFSLITDHDMICIIDKKHRIWIHDWSSSGKFYELLPNDEFCLNSNNNNHQYFIDINEKYLCFTDCQEHLYIFSNCLTAINWSLVEKDTRLQRLTGSFPNETHVWALSTDGTICSSNGQILEKPRQAQYLTHASFVPQMDSQIILWSLDESCNIYIRNNLDNNSPWEQLDQSQFEWSRRLVDIVCNTVGVWAVDDRGCIHFRHGHGSNSNEYSVLSAAWIPIPGEPQHRRSFAQIFCGPEEWMVYATDNKQTVYARIGIADDNHVGTSWEVIEECSALGLAISEHTLWLLTSHGRIQCRENISLEHPIGTRSTTLPGRFNSIAVSTDDDQVWALYPPHHLYKLDRLNILFEK